MSFICKVDLRFYAFRREAFFKKTANTLFQKKTLYAHTRYHFIYRSQNLTLTEIGLRVLGTPIGNCTYWKGGTLYAADGLLQGNGMLWKSNCPDMNLQVISTCIPGLLEEY